MKLELKYLAPYLPYGLECKTKDTSGQIWILGTENIQYALTWWRPLLIPLENAIIPYENTPVDEYGQKEPNDLFIDQNGGHYIANGTNFFFNKFLVHGKPRLLC